MEKREPAAEPQPNVERKPYSAPRIEESGSFEHLVLACGKIPGAPGPCRGSGATSPG